MNTEEDYQPYGPEWEKEMMKWNKRHLVDWVRRLLTSQEQDYLESITDQLKQRDETIKALKEALRETIVFADVYHSKIKRNCEAIPNSVGWQAQNDSMKDIIDKARKLITE